MFSIFIFALFHANNTSRTCACMAFGFRIRIWIKRGRRRNDFNKKKNEMWSCWINIMLLHRMKEERINEGWIHEINGNFYFFLLDSFLKCASHNRFCHICSIHFICIFYFFAGFSRFFCSPYMIGIQFSGCSFFL